MIDYDLAHRMIDTLGPEKKLLYGWYKWLMYSFNSVTLIDTRIRFSYLKLDKPLNWKVKTSKT